MSKKAYSLYLSTERMDDVKIRAIKDGVRFSHVIESAIDFYLGEKRDDSTKSKTKKR